MHDDTLKSGLRQGFPWGFYNYGFLPHLCYAMLTIFFAIISIRAAVRTEREVSVLDLI